MNSTTEPPTDRAFTFGKCVVAAVVAACLLVPAPSAQAQIGNCIFATASSELNIGNVRAGVSNDNRMFWFNGGYQVPKDGPDIIFTTFLWLQGEVGGGLVQSAGNYSRTGFWPGPLDDAGAAPADCAQYDSVWTVSTLDIAALEAGIDTTADIRSWPTGLGAPTRDANGNPVDISGLSFEERDTLLIDLDAGQRPSIRGHQMSWWIMNDRGNSGPFAPLGVETRVSAFAFSTADALDNTTVYRFDITNRSGATIDDVRVGFYMDADLGTVFDDYVGSDSTLGLGYVYNSVDEDTTSYGAAMPAIGVVLLESPAPVHNILPWRSVGGSADQLITRLMRGFQEDFSPFREWGDGTTHDTTKATTRFVFSGDPPAFWSEPNSGGATHAAGDRNIDVNTSPHTLAAGETISATYGIVWSRGSDHYNSVATLKADAGAVKAQYASTNGFRDMVAFVGVEGAPEGRDTIDDLAVSVYPNPTYGELSVAFDLPYSQEVAVEVFDAIGRRVRVGYVGALGSGRHDQRVDLRSQARGVYFVRVTVDGVPATRAVVLE